LLAESGIKDISPLTTIMLAAKWPNIRCEVSWR